MVMSKRRLVTPVTGKAKRRLKSLSGLGSTIVKLRLPLVPVTEKTRATLAAVLKKLGVEV